MGNKNKWTDRLVQISLVDAFFGAFVATVLILVNLVEREITSPIQKFVRGWPTSYLTEHQFSKPEFSLSAFCIDLAFIALIGIAVTACVSFVRNLILPQSTNKKLNGCRFGLKSMILTVCVAAFMIWSFGPLSLRVGFGPVTENSDGTYSYNATNYGLLPIQYRFSEFQNRCLTAEMNAGSTAPRVEGHQFAPWTNIGFMQTVEIRDDLPPDGTRIGVQFRDYLGWREIVWQPNAFYRNQ